MAKHPDWFGFSFAAARLGWEAHAVIGLRMMKLAAGGAAADAEAVRMVSEKAEALVEAQFAMVRDVMLGRAHLVPGRTIAGYRKRVRANRRRLTRSA